MRIFLVICFLFVVGITYTQSDIVTIDSIMVEGNRRTLTRIVLRELTLRKGDRLPVAELPGELKRSRDFLMNTRMFSDAQITYQNWDGATNRIHLKVEVQ